MIQWKREKNDHKNYFTINLQESMGPGQDQTGNPGSAVRLASIARYVTDCTTRPGPSGTLLKLFSHYKIKKTALTNLKMKCLNVLALIRLLPLI